MAAAAYALGWRASAAAARETWRDDATTLGCIVHTALETSLEILESVFVKTVSGSCMCLWSLQCEELACVMITNYLLIRRRVPWDIKSEQKCRGINFPLITYMVYASIRLIDSTSFTIISKNHQVSGI